jgi:hypothetical protein
MKAARLRRPSVEGHRRRLPFVVRHFTSTIERLELLSQELPTCDCAANDARTWLLRHLRWEHRLVELRAKHERSRT